MNLSKWGFFKVIILVLFLGFSSFFIAGGDGNSNYFTLSLIFPDDIGDLCILVNEPIKFW